MCLQKLIMPISISILTISSTTHMSLSGTSESDRMHRAVSKEVLYGVNGHSVRVNRGEYISQYNQFSIKEQVDLLKKLGVSIYRTDIYFNETGFFNGPDSPEKFEDLVRLAKEAEIQVLPLLSTYPWMKAYDDPTEPFLIGSDWNYLELIKQLNNLDSVAQKHIKSLDIWQHYHKRGFQSGELFAATYGKDLVYYNTGNEIAYYISKMYPHPLNPVPNPTPEQTEAFFIETFRGDEISSFFSTEEHARRTLASAAYISGLIDGVKSKDGDAKCVISEGKINFGYFKFLDFMEVKYDIIGWNWYEGNFNQRNYKLHGLNVYEELSKLAKGKPIWITEMNRFAGSRNYSGESVYAAEIEQANLIYQHLDKYSSLPNVQAVFVYELIDQEYKFETRWEDYYGLITSPFPNKSSAKIKPAFDMYRYAIQELNHGKEDYIFAVLNFFIKQPAELDTHMESISYSGKTINDEAWLNEVTLNLGNDIKWLAPEYQISKEDLNQFVARIYKELMNQTANKSTVRTLKRRLRKLSPREWLVELFLSEEFKRNAIWSGYERRTSFSRP